MPDLSAALPEGAIMMGLFQCPKLRYGLRAFARIEQSSTIQKTSRAPTSGTTIEIPPDKAALPGGAITIALVTGAGSGIGRATALALQSAGYAVVLAGRRAAELDKTMAMGDRSGCRMLAVLTDVSQPESVNALFARVKEEFGRVDVLMATKMSLVGRG